MLAISGNRSSDKDRILSFLSRTSEDFIPPLAGRVNLSDYSTKLATKATNYFISKDGIDIGHAAVYNKNQSIAFISSFCIAREFQRMSLGGKLIEEVIKDSVVRKNVEIGLRVALGNSCARSFYLRHGFLVLENDGETIFMLRKLR